MEDVKQTFGKNLSELRSKLGITQLELAEKLNYSDKTVSKWERGESIPDVAILTKLAEVFHVSVDSLLTDASEREKETKKAYVHVPSEEEKKKERYRHSLIKWIAIAGTWALSLVVVVVLWAIFDHVFWQAFIFTLPVHFILEIVFTAIWTEKSVIRNAVNIFMLVFSVLLSIFIAVPGNSWMIFLLLIPSLIIVALSARLYDTRDLEKRAEKRRRKAAEKENGDNSEKPSK